MLFRGIFLLIIRLFFYLFFCFFHLFRLGIFGSKNKCNSDLFLLFFRHYFSFFLAIFCSLFLLFFLQKNRTEGSVFLTAKVLFFYLCFYLIFIGVFRKKKEIFSLPFFLQKGNILNNLTCNNQSHNRRYKRYAARYTALFFITDLRCPYR